MPADILLGVVIGAHGLKGEVRVKTFTETPDRLCAYGPLHGKDGRVFTVTAARVTAPDGAVVRLDGVGDRTGAEALKGLQLFVARAALPKTEAEEFYHADLVGLRAEDGEGRLIGHVRGIHNFGAGDVLDIEKPDGSEALLPFTRDFVPVVDVKSGRITIAVPEEVEARADNPGAVE
ncbi:MAG: ribosome maturation factor RimM [Pseudomonadota bacterium]|nr:ribosome maturation factor RimM [Pseudomonadota bacterium]